MTEKLKLIDGIEFLEEKHYYRVNGNFIPSVSSIIRPISSQIYDGIDEDVLRKARDRGTDVHLAVEIYDDAGAEIISSENKGYFDAYKAFRSEHLELVPIATEFRVYEPTLWFAGTVDKILYDAKRGINILVDVKTSYNIEYATLIPQLTGYERALKAHGIEISETRVLHLKNDSTYDYREIKTDFDIFISCLSIKKFLDKHKRSYSK